MALNGDGVHRHVIKKSPTDASKIKLEQPTYDDPMIDQYCTININNLITSHFAQTTEFCTRQKKIFRVSKIYGAHAGI